MVKDIKRSIVSICVWLSLVYVVGWGPAAQMENSNLLLFPVFDSSLHISEVSLVLTQSTTEMLYCLKRWLTFSLDEIVVFGMSNIDSIFKKHK